MRFKRRAVQIAMVAALAVAAVSAGVYLAENSQGSLSAIDSQAKAAQNRADPGAPASQSVTLEEKQLKAIKIEAVGLRLFDVEREAVGNIAFDDDRSVQVFPPNAGKIIELFHDLGDYVSRGEKLYTVDSPDLVAAESTLIAAAGVLQLDNHVLERAKQLYETQGVPQKELQQAISDQQTAEGAYHAARHAVSIFGKTEADMDRVVAERRIDPAMVVRSPITGRITARNGAPGLLAEPGSSPAPYTVADISTVWMVANVTESDSPFFRTGQRVKVRLAAFPDRVFEGNISNMGANLDPSTHRLMVRSVIRDPLHELRPGMLATFSIRTAAPMKSVAVPEDAIVREGDGTMTAWVTSDRRKFTQKAVKLGIQKDGWYQILEGLEPNESVVTEGAIFLSNVLNAPPSD